MEAQLDLLEADLSTACDDPRADCSGDGLQSDASSDAGGVINTDLIIIILGVLILAALLGVMFTRRGGAAAVPKWDEATLPSADTVANSMYGGAQAIFQQPLAPAIPAPALPTLAIPAPALPAAPVYAGPPLPATGLPAGWTM
ncbi:MAG TPA: hypothetical protein D7H96_01900, partial [Candidatus Poseidoniales archaeon]